MRAGYYLLEVRCGTGSSLISALLVDDKEGGQLTEEVSSISTARCSSNLLPLVVLLTLLGLSVPPISLIGLPSNICAGRRNAAGGNPGPPSARSPGAGFAWRLFISISLPFLSAFEKLVREEVVTPTKGKI